MKVISCFFILFFCLFSFVKTSFSQRKEAYNWYFGQNAGLTFQMGSPPSALMDGQINSPASSGTVSMSDSNGNLMFYSDGVTIWNKNHQVMQNGTNLGVNSTQCMCVQYPGNEEKYFLFNFSGSGLQYSIIDMSNGIGSVNPVSKCIFLYNNTTWNVSAVKHANNSDSWLITHELGSNKFMAFLINNDSISAQPVISLAGNNATGQAGYMKISPNGKLIAMSLIEDNLTQLFHFDNLTALVSNQNVVTLQGSHGVEFSPDNSLLYTNGGGTGLFQYDLTSNDPSIIAASCITLSNQSFAPGALQLGPDEKIYVAHQGNYLSVIHNPNFRGLMCNFEFNGISLEGRVCTGGLPSFNQTYFKEPGFNAWPLCSGEPTEFSIINLGSADSVRWKFYDAGNPLNDTSTEFNPSYIFSSPGTYFPRLTVYSGFNSMTVTDTVIIHITPQPFLGNDTILCHDSPVNLTLDAGQGDLYNWNSSMVPGNQFYTVTETGVFWVRVKSNGCYGYDTILVIKYPEPVITVNVSPETDTNQNGTITVIATGNGILSFQLNNLTPQSSSTFTNLSAGTYTLIVSDEFGCIVSQVIVVERESSSAISENPQNNYPLKFPTLISPDGDGYDDTFSPTVDWQQIKWYNLTVYNLHGQIQFKTSCLNHYWDAQNAKAGLYPWVAVFENKSGKIEEVTGKALVVK